MGRSLRGRFSGVVRYTHELVRALEPRLKSDLSVFVTRAPHGIGEMRIRRIAAPFPTPNEYARAAWEQAVVPIELARMRPDVYHSPNYILPLAMTCPAVVTIHDLFYLDPKLQRARSHMYLTLLSTLAIAKARRVICVSEHTRDQLVRRHPRAESKVRVISEGVDPRFRPSTPQETAAMRRRLGLERPYVLFVGTLEPRKNLPRVIRAFTEVAERLDLPHELVIAGGRGWMNESVNQAMEQSSRRAQIRLAGYVDDADMPALYAGAEIFVFPSLVEGFGLPPLEAMACGTAVLTSATGSLPEVVGDAALLVDPLDEASIAAGIEKLLCDGEARHALAGAGRLRARNFDWNRAAEETIAVYAEAAS